MGSLLWGFHTKGPNDDSILYHKMCPKRKGNTRLCNRFSDHKVNDMFSCGKHDILNRIAVQCDTSLRDMIYSFASERMLYIAFSACGKGFSSKREKYEGEIYQMRRLFGALRGI